MDAYPDSKFTLEEFEEICGELVDANLPWNEGAKDWKLVDPASEKIDLGKFLSRFVVSINADSYSSFIVKAVKMVYEGLVKMDMDMEATMKLFDADGDGTVDGLELRAVLSKFSLGLTDSQLDRLSAELFHAAGGASLHSRVKIQDFLKNFTVTYKQTKDAVGHEGPRLDAWVHEVLEKIAILIMKCPADKLTSDLDEAAVKIQKVFRGKEARRAKQAGAVDDNQTPSSAAKAKANTAKGQGGSEQTEMPE
eukprot:5043559-Amphidinium_carterae.1